ncbi:uncharacterized protein LOC123948921 isoform X2 [Meles meles]|uniref:uncharacterized protein LOC123948921 isoform X2 n=1 Tax=Meles meles TaxID=9662 RepID=UPI001E69D2DC|nr:uncharacterized protein LOC123948921 isoform X2 [Meles meles]
MACRGSQGSGLCSDGCCGSERLVPGIWRHRVGSKFLIRAFPERLKRTLPGDFPREQNLQFARSLATEVAWPVCRGQLGPEREQQTAPEAESVLISRGWGSCELHSCEWEFCALHVRQAGPARRQLLWPYYCFSTNAGSPGLSFRQVQCLHSGTLIGLVLSSVWPDPHRQAYGPIDINLRNQIRKAEGCKEAVAGGRAPLPASTARRRGRLHSISLGVHTEICSPGSPARPTHQGPARPGSLCPREAPAGVLGSTGPRRPLSGSWTRIKDTSCDVPPKVETELPMTQQSRAGCSPKGYKCGEGARAPERLEQQRPQEPDCGQSPDVRPRTDGARMSTCRQMDGEDMVRAHRKRTQPSGETESCHLRRRGWG